MNSALLVVAIILVAVILWLATQVSQSQKKGSVLETQLTELRRDLLSIAQTQSQSAGQIQTIGQSFSQRLESGAKALTGGVSLATHPLENILGGTKTRALLGEVTLQRLLEDSLPSSQLSLQYRFYP